MASLVVVPSGAQVASGTLAYSVPGGRLLSVNLQLTVSAASGSAPTFDLYLQHSVDDGNGATTWDDFIHFAQMTGTGQQYAQWIRDVTPTSPVHAQKNLALTAGTVNQGPVGSKWQFAWVIAGTTPSFTFEVWAEHLHGPTE